MYDRVMNHPSLKAIITTEEYDLLSPEDKRYYQQVYSEQEEEDYELIEEPEFGMGAILGGLNIDEYGLDDVNLLEDDTDWN